MRLTGWTRLAIFLMVLWTIIVAWATWATWPPTYLSMDPGAGVPVGADVTPLMDGIVKNNEKLTSAELARRIKGKYPQYDDLTDEQLIDKFLRTYPQYRGYISDLNWFQRNAPDSAAEAASVNALNRERALWRALWLWLLPPFGASAFVSGIRWVYTGFRKESR